MSLTLIVTPGDATANAYCSLDEANAYHAARPPASTAWDDADDEQKKAAIMWATKLLDSLWEWTGFVTDDVQNLLWPRQSMLKKNQLQYVDVHTIPAELKDATAEYARQLLESDLAGNSLLETFGVKQLTAGPVSFQFKDDVRAKPVPDTVVNLIPPSWGYPRTAMAGVRPLVRA